MSLRRGAGGDHHPLYFNVRKYGARGDSVVLYGLIGTADSPTVTATLAFPEAFDSDPFPTVSRTNGTAGFEVTSHSASQCVFGFNGTASGTNTYKFCWHIEE